MKKCRVGTLAAGAAVAAALLAAIWMVFAVVLTLCWHRDRLLLTNALASGYQSGAQAEYDGASIPADRALLDYTYSVVMDSHTVAARRMRQAPAMAEDALQLHLPEAAVTFFPADGQGMLCIRFAGADGTAWCYTLHTQSGFDYLLRCFANAQRQLP